MLDLTGVDTEADPMQVVDSEVFTSDRLVFAFMPPREEDFLRPK